MELHSAAQGHPHFWSIFSIFVSILQYLIIINSFKQEDHDDPISLTWANRFAYLLVKFQPSSLL